jgi:hypothetical protein
MVKRNLRLPNADAALQREAERNLARRFFAAVR